MPNLYDPTPSTPSFCVLLYRPRTHLGNGISGWRSRRGLQPAAGLTPTWDTSQDPRSTFRTLKGLKLALGAHIIARPRALSISGQRPSQVSDMMVTIPHTCTVHVQLLWWRQLQRPLHNRSLSIWPSQTHMNPLRLHRYTKTCEFQNKLIPNLCRLLNTGSFSACSQYVTHPPIHQCTT